jgi:hypothetical protein
MTLKYKKKSFGTHEYALELLEHKFSGISFKYGRVEFIEKEDNLTLKFDYDIIDNKHSAINEIPEADKDEFKTALGDLLVQMMQEGVKNNDLIYTGGVDEN